MTQTTKTISSLLRIPYELPCLKLDLVVTHDYFGTSAPNKGVDLRVFEMNVPKFEFEVRLSNKGFTHYSKVGTGPVPQSWPGRGVCTFEKLPFSSTFERFFAETLGEKTLNQLDESLLPSMGCFEKESKRILELTGIEKFYTDRKIRARFLEKCFWAYRYMVLNGGSTHLGPEPGGFVDALLGRRLRVFFCPKNLFELKVCFFFQIVADLYSSVLHYDSTIRQYVNHPGDLLGSPVITLYGLTPLELLILSGGGIINGDSMVSFDPSGDDFLRLLPQACLLHEMTGVSPVLDPDSPIHASIPTQCNRCCVPEIPIKPWTDDVLIYDDFYSEAQFELYYGASLRLVRGGRRKAGN